MPKWHHKMLTLAKDIIEHLMVESLKSRNVTLNILSLVFITEPIYIDTQII